PRAASLARKARGHRRSDQLLSGILQSQIQLPGEAYLHGINGRVAEISLARQCARTRELDQALRDSGLGGGNFERSCDSGAGILQSRDQRGWPDFAEKADPPGDAGAGAESNPEGSAGPSLESETSREGFEHQLPCSALQNSGRWFAIQSHRPASRIIRGHRL